MRSLATGALPQLNEDDPSENIQVARFGRGGVNNIETGEVPLASGQLTVEVTFAYEKSTAAYIFNPAPYVKDPNDPPQVIVAVVVSQTTRGFTVKLSAAPGTGLSTLHWGVAVVDEVYVNGPAPVAPVYVLDTNLVHLTGDETIGERKTFTGQVVGEMWDKGGERYNVLAYGTAADGVAAINAAQAAIIADGGQGTITVPGTTILCSGDIVLGSGINLVSTGRYGSVLQFASGGLVLGASGNVFNGKVAGITVEGTTDFSTILNGSIGIKALYYQSATIEDCFVATFDIGIKAGGNNSSPLDILNTTVFNVKSKSIWLQDAIGVNLMGVYFGKPGILNSPSVALLTISGVSDTVFGQCLQMLGSDFYAPPTCAAILFENFTGGNGGFHFNQINTEKVLSVVKSDSNTPNVNQLQIVNSRLTSGGKFFDPDTATEWDSLDISHNVQIDFYTNTTIGKLFRSKFIANTITRNSSASTLTFAGANGQLNFSENTSECDVVLSGPWKGLISTQNTFRLNGGTEVGYTADAATGIVISDFNVKDAGTQPTAIYLVGAVSSKWSAMSSLLAGGWSNITAAPTYFRNDHPDLVRMKGSIHNGTLTQGTIWLNQLPVGSRPPATVTLRIPCGTGGVNISIDSNGIGRLDSDAPFATSISLEGVFFATTT